MILKPHEFAYVSNRSMGSACPEKGTVYMVSSDAVTTYIYDSKDFLLAPTEISKINSGGNIKHHVVWRLKR